MVPKGAWAVSKIVVGPLIDSVFVKSKEPSRTRQTGATAQEFRLEGKGTIETQGVLANE